MYSFLFYQNSVEMSMIIISDASCAVEQLQDVDAKSGVDYAGARVQEVEGKIGEYVAFGMERIGRWGMRVTVTQLRRMYRWQGEV